MEDTSVLIPSTHSRNYLGYLTGKRSTATAISTHSRNYLGYLTETRELCRQLSTHSRNYLGYLTFVVHKPSLYLHTVEII